jgi:hypothetical protein
MLMAFPRTFCARRDAGPSIACALEQVSKATE